MKDAIRELMPVAGGVGAFATLELTQINDAVKLVIGCATLVYLAFRIGWAYKQYRNK